MDSSDSQAAAAAAENSDQADESHYVAHRAAEGLKSQIEALRRQVKDAQDTLRDHKRRQEMRSFKR